jgi:hypothetical protein
LPMLFKLSTQSYPSNSIFTFLWNKGRNGDGKI